MIKPTGTLNIIWMSTMLLSTLSVRSMEKPCEEHTQWEQLALIAEKYNNHDCLLTRLPNEQLIDIFSYCLADDTDQVKSLENSITAFMRLSIACKSFNTLLTFEVIGNFCKNYIQNHKNETLHKLMHPTFLSECYKIKRLPILILVCAGAKADATSLGNELLHFATIANDAQLIATLFKHHANPQAKWCGTPIFFHATTIELAQMFIGKGVNVHAKNDEDKTNVLWTIVNNQFPSNFMALYLEHRVNAKELNVYNDCLLHALAAKSKYVYCTINNIDDFLTKSKLLLDTIPDMVNTVNRKSQTPIDAAQKSFERSEKIGSPDAHAFKQLIALFRAYSGLTAQELAQKATLLEEAVSTNDTKLATMLFKCDADPNTRTISTEPIFFRAKTIDMAHIFINNGVNLHAYQEGLDTTPNVLWHITYNQYPPELMALYLKHHVDAKKLRPLDGSCLLHEFAKLRLIENSDEFLETATLLLEAIPDMINTLNKDEKTPTDILLASIQEYMRYNAYPPKYFGQLIKLFKKYGGLTAKELMQETPLLKRKSSRCIIS